MDADTIQLQECSYCEGTGESPLSWNLACPEEDKAIHIVCSVCDGTGINPERSAELNAIKASLGR